MPKDFYDINEFVEFGYLQEVNRQFFHPLGLALSVVVDDIGVASLDGIFDSRTDLEGFIFEDLTEADAFHKYQNIEREQQYRWSERTKRLGYFIQPMGIQSAE